MTAEDLLNSEAFRNWTIELHQQYNTAIATVREQLEAQISAVSATQTTLIQQLEGALNTLTARLDSAMSQGINLATTSAQPAGIQPAVPGVQPAVTPAPSGRQQLPHPEYFDGKDRLAYGPWRTAMQAKLQLEGRTIGDSTAQFYYIHSRLKDRALQMVSAFVDQCRQVNRYEPDEFIDYLSTIYDDPNKAEKALRELHSLKQAKNASFARFLPLFEKALAEAGGLQWPHSVRINHLYNALAPDLKRALVTVQLPDEFPAYVRQIQDISSRLEGLERPGSTGNRSKKPSSSANDNAMEWEPTTTTVGSSALQQANAALKGKRAKWVSREEMQKRRKENRCLRCGRKGCKPEKCPLLPAKPPESPSTRVNSSATVQALVNSAAVEIPESEN